MKRNVGRVAENVFVVGALLLALLIILIENKGRSEQHLGVAQCLSPVACPPSYETTNSQQQQYEQPRPYQSI